MAAPGGPFTLAVSPDRNHLYCGTRETPQLISFRIDQSGGGLTQTGTVLLDSWPVLRQHGPEGQVRVVILLPGSTGSQCTPSGTTGRWEEPQSYRWKRRPGLTRCRPTRPTATLSFLTSRETAPTRSGSSSSTRTRAKSPPTLRRSVEPEEFLGPRHFCFHPSLDVLYFSNEQGCSVSGYRLDAAAGTLSIFQTITTLPPEGFAERNACSQIQITGAGRFLYAPNRGHDSIACYTVDTPAPANWPPTASLLQRQDLTRCALAPGTGTSTRPARIRARWPYSASIPIPAR